MILAEAQGRSQGKRDWNWKICIQNTLLTGLELVAISFLLSELSQEQQEAASKYDQCLSKVTLSCILMVSNVGMFNLRDCQEASIIGSHLGGLAPTLECFLFCESL